MCSHYGVSHPTKKLFKQQRNNKGNNKSTFNSRNSNNRHTEHNGQKPNTYFKCGLDDHFVANCQKPDTLENKVNWNMENPKNRAYRYMEMDKMSDNSIDQSECQKIYTSMAPMSSNAESTRRYFGDSSQLSNWIIDSGATCHMTPDISDFISIIFHYYVNEFGVYLPLS